MPHRAQTQSYRPSTPGTSIRIERAAGARGARSTIPHAHERRSSARPRGASHLLGYALAAGAAIIALAGLKVVAPAFTTASPPLATAPALSRFEPPASTAHEPPPGGIAANPNTAAAPIVLSDADRGILAKLSGSWRSEAGKMTIDGAMARMHLSGQRGLSEPLLNIRELSYPFIIVEGSAAKYTILLREESFMIYSTSLFPPIEFHRD